MTSRLILAKFSTSGTFILHLDETIQTIGDLKELIKKEKDVPVEHQIITWYGKPLDNDEKVDRCDFGGNVFMIIVRPR